MSDRNLVITYLSATGHTRRHGRTSADYSRPLDLLTLTVIAICLVAAIWRNRDLGWNYDWLKIVAMILLLYLLSDFSGSETPGPGYRNLGDANVPHLWQLNAKEA